MGVMAPQRMIKDGVDIYFISLLSLGWIRQLEGLRVLNSKKEEEGGEEEEEEGKKD